MKHTKRSKKASSAGSSGQEPRFGQPQPSPDPSSFVTPHPSDADLYKETNTNLLQPIPAPRDASNLVLTLDSTLGPNGAQIVKGIAAGGQIVFHSLGDTGSLRGPATQSLVADKLAQDFQGEAAKDTPAFLYHLGDLVYSFGEAKYYYDQFYEPYRNYPAPIVAIPGNHDGVVYTGDPATSLDAFLRNFVNIEAVHTPEAAGLVRTAMTQPGVYFAFDAPFVTIIGLYSNVLEDPGVISGQGDASSPVDDQQLAFLRAQLKRVKGSGRAVFVATHHPPYTGGTNHVGSPKMLRDLDDACNKAGFWPHLFLSGHAHNYQRYTRAVGKFDVPYVVCGTGGHGLSRMRVQKGDVLRAPIQLTKDIILENYDDQDYGYLRIVCNATQLRVEFHVATADQTIKSPDDAVTVDLATHTMVSN